jgi:hypothetical protein
VDASWRDDSTNLFMKVEALGEDHFASLSRKQPRWRNEARRGFGEAGALQDGLACLKAPLGSGGIGAKKLALAAREGVCPE